MVSKRAFQNSAAHSVTDAGFCNVLFLLLPCLFTMLKVLMLFLNKELDVHHFPKSDFHTHIVPNMSEATQTCWKRYLPGLEAV